MPIILHAGFAIIKTELLTHEQIPVELLLHVDTLLTWNTVIKYEGESLTLMELSFLQERQPQTN